jgi:histone-lysine N-methyltransferase SETMAR
MVFLFFDAKGIFHTNYVPKGKAVNAEHIKKVVARFLKIFRKKRLIMSSQVWWLH